MNIELLFAELREIILELPPNFSDLKINAFCSVTSVIVLLTIAYSVLRGQRNKRLLSILITGLLIGVYQLTHIIYLKTISDIPLRISLHLFFIGFITVVLQDRNFGAYDLNINNNNTQNEILKDINVNVSCIFLLMIPTMLEFATKITMLGLFKLFSVGTTIMLFFSFKYWFELSCNLIFLSWSADLFYHIFYGDLEINRILNSLGIICSMLLGLYYKCITEDLQNSNDIEQQNTSCLETISVKEREKEKPTYPID